MMISVKKERFSSLSFDSEEFVIDLNRKFEGYERGDIIIHGTPFDTTGVFPLRLELAIRKNGELIFRSWSFAGGCNSYFHVNDNITPDEYIPTQEQIDTANGLFSGRIKFEGLKLAIGKSIQKMCPIDLKEEEKRIGRNIYVM